MVRPELVVIGEKLFLVEGVVGIFGEIADISIVFGDYVRLLEGGLISDFGWVSAHVVIDSLNIMKYSLSLELVTKMMLNINSSWGSGR